MILYPTWTYAMRVATANAVQSGLRQQVRRRPEGWRVGPVEVPTCS